MQFKLARADARHIKQVAGQTILHADLVPRALQVALNLLKPAGHLFTRLYAMRQQCAQGALRELKVAFQRGQWPLEFVAGNAEKLIEAIVDFLQCQGVCTRLGLLLQQAFALMHQPGQFGNGFCQGFFRGCQYGVMLAIDQSKHAEQVVPQKHRSLHQQRCVHSRTWPQGMDHDFIVAQTVHIGPLRRGRTQEVHGFLPPGRLAHVRRVAVGEQLPLRGVRFKGDHLHLLTLQDCGDEWPQALPGQLQSRCLVGGSSREKFRRVFR